MPDASTVSLEMPMRGSQSVKTEWTIYAMAEWQIQPMLIEDSELCRFFFHGRERNPTFLPLIRNRNSLYWEKLNQIFFFLFFPISARKVCCTKQWNSGCGILLSYKCTISSRIASGVSRSLSRLKKLSAKWFKLHYTWRRAHQIWIRFLPGPTW